MKFNEHYELMRNEFELMAKKLIDDGNAVIIISDGRMGCDNNGRAYQIFHLEFLDMGITAPLPVFCDTPNTVRTLLYGALTATAHLGKGNNLPHEGDVLKPLCDNRLECADRINCLITILEGIGPGLGSLDSTLPDGTPEKPFVANVIGMDDIEAYKVWKRNQMN